MESFRAECVALRNSSSLMLKDQGLTQLGRFLPILVTSLSKTYSFGAIAQSQHLFFFLFSLISQRTLHGFLGGEQCSRSEPFLNWRHMTLPITSSEAQNHDLILRAQTMEKGSPGFESWYCHLSAVGCGASHSFIYKTVNQLSSYWALVLFQAWNKSTRSL